MHRQAFIAIYLLLLLAACSSEEPAIDTITSLAAKKADSLQKATNIPGIFIGILDNGKRSYVNAGYADPGKKMPFDSATIFEIGSITKTFTAYILEKVLQEKKISDTSSILQYLPDSIKLNRRLKNIRFTNLMNHTSGLPRLPENMDQLAISMTPYDDYGDLKLYEYLRTVIPDSTNQFVYSNLGAGLGGILAERISGKEYSGLLRDHIFDPFGMNRSALTLSSTSNIGQGYAAHDKSPYWNMNILAPAGGIKSSAHDLLTYLGQLSLLAKKAGDTTVKKLLKPTVTAAPGVQVGLGWFIAEGKGKPDIYWHDGGTYGFSTFAAFTNNAQNAVVVVINRFDKNTICDEIGMLLIKKLAHQ